MSLWIVLCVWLQYLCSFLAENEDYVRLSETVTLSPSVSKQCVFVTIISDSAVELNENLTVTISLIEQLSSVEVSPFSTAVVILDDDSESVLLVGYEGFSFVVHGTQAH